MTGYTRQDTNNSIANGNVVDADVFDSEYNAIENAFNNTSGHTHDGTSGEGAPIEKVGPAQDLIVSGTAVLPKTTNTLDLGSAGVQYKDAFFDGLVNTDTLSVDENATVSGTLGVTGVTTLGNNLNVTGATGIDGDFNINTNKFTVNATSGNTTIGGTLLTGATTVAGTLNAAGAATVGDTLDVIGQITGNLTGNVTGDLTGNADTATAWETSRTLSLTGDVTGTVSGVDGTGDISISTTIQPNSVALGTDTTGNYVASLTAGTGVTITNNTGEGATPTVAIGQAVGTTSNVTFNDVVVSGSLTVSGTTTTVNTETVNIADNLIVLNSNYTGSSPTEEGGIEIERGTQANKKLVWDETNDKWTVGSETFVAGTFEGNVTGTVSSLSNHSTTNLSEGTNLYYTNARADARIAAASITDLSDANQTVRTTDSPTFAGLTTTGTADVASLTIGNFELVDNGAGLLYIKYLGSTMIVFDAFNGDIVAAGDIVAYGSI